MSVSVVITCHDEGRTIEQAVRSVAAQTIVRPRTRNHRCQRRVAGWVANLARGAGYKIAKLRVLETSGVGAAGARNAGLREAQGLFIALLDGDDFWAPEKLAHQLPAFSHRNNIGLVYSDFVDFSRDDVADGRIITVRRFDPASPYQLRDYFVNDGPIMPSTAVLSRSVFDDVGLFDESLLIGEDTEFCLRVAEKWRFCHVPRRSSRLSAVTLVRISSRLDGFLPTTLLVYAGICRTPFRIQGSRWPPHRASPCEGRARLCKMKGEWRRALSLRDDSHSPRPVLLASLGQLGSAARAGVGRAALLRGAQEALARLAAVVAFRSDLIVRRPRCAFSTW